MSRPDAGAPATQAVRRKLRSFADIPEWIAACPLVQALREAVPLRQLAAIYWQLSLSCRLLG